MFFLFSTVLWGLLAAALLQSIFSHLMDFRAQWFDTLFAAVLTGGLVGAAYFCTDRLFDAGSGAGLPRVFGVTFIISFIGSLFAFRFMIKSEAGNFLSWAVAAGVALVLVSAPLAVMFLILVIG